jgi:hypothetical protein
MERPLRHVRKVPKAEVIKPHSITSSAVESSSYGMDIPNALGVLPQPWITRRILVDVHSVLRMWL